MARNSGLIAETTLCGNMVTELRNMTNDVLEETHQQCRDRILLSLRHSPSTESWGYKVLNGSINMSASCKSDNLFCQQLLFHWERYRNEVSPQHVIRFLDAVLDDPTIELLELAH